MIDRAKSDHPESSVVVVAHSMGSFATQQFLLDYGTEVDAVALTGTAALTFLNRPWICRAIWTCPRSTRPFSLRAPTSTGCPATRLSSMRISLIRCAASASMPLPPKTCSLVLGDSRTPPRSRVFPTTCPSISRSDPRTPSTPTSLCCGHSSTVTATAGLADVIVRVYDDARHEILNETNRAEVIDDLLVWLHRVAAIPVVHDTSSTTNRTKS